MRHHESDPGLLQVRLATSQRMAAIGDWSSDAEYRNVRCSDEVYSILGLSPNGPDMEADAFYKQVHPDDLEGLRQRQDTMSASMSRLSVDHRIIRPDGQIRQVQQRSEVVLDTDGRITGFIGTIQDITELKGAEEELRGKTAVLESQLNASIDGILIVDHNGRAILRNDRFVEIWGMPLHMSELGNDKTQLEHALSRVKDPKDFWQKILHLYAHPTEISRDEIELCDGTVLDRYSAPVNGKHGVHYGRIWTFRDISSQKLAQASLGESKERFKLVAKTIGDVIWDWNLLTDKIWRSDGFENSFGFTDVSADESQSIWENLVHEDDRVRISDSLQIAIDGSGLTWTDEYRVLKRDGTYAFVTDRAQIVRDADGKAVRMVGGIRDLTEQRNFEARLLRSQRIESIGVLAGGIAHDLNNILAPILMSIDMLKQNAPAGEQTMRLLDIIQASTMRGADLVRQVMTFSRGADGEYVAINFRHLFNELEKIIKETFPSNIRIRFEAPHGLWPVMGDASQMHQILLNLAVNARDAMPAGGDLTFSVSNLKQTELPPGVERKVEPGCYLHLEVTDSGCGMTPEVRSRIFEAFYTTKEAGKGTGLGLASVHAIVQKYHGIMDVVSTVNVGTTFKILIPVDPAQRTDSRPPMMIGNQRGNGETVLLIEDERSIRDIAQQTLEGFGYQVIVAGDGIEGIALYKRNAKSIGVVITDMMMPNCDGATAVQRLLEINPQVRIIAASGSMEQLKLGALPGGIDYLDKPYSAATMLKLIREVLDRPAASE